MNRRIGASIVVPSRAGARRLPVLLAALARQDCNDFEAIIVIDGDIDNSSDVVNNFAAEVGMPVRVVTFAENRGRPAALNAGADVACGRVLIRCDDDLEPDPDYVSGHLAQHTDEVIGIVGLCRNVFPETPYARVYGRDADERFRAEALQSRTARHWRYWGGNVSLLREVHQRLGGYDESYRAYGWEDVDYGYRLHRMGIPVRIESSLTTTHHAAATTTPVRALRALHSGAARETFNIKHGMNALDAGSATSGPWAKLVAGASKLATERTIQRWGSAVDTASTVLPRRVSEKLVALAVESAGRAGIQHPHRARAHF